MSTLDCHSQLPRHVVRLCLVLKLLSEMGKFVIGGGGVELNIFSERRMSRALSQVLSLLSCSTNLTMRTRNPQQAGNREEDVLLHSGTPLGMLFCEVCFLCFVLFHVDLIEQCVFLSKLPAFLFKMK